MTDQTEPGARGSKGLFGGVFDRGGAATDDTAWLQAMLDAEAGLARALERAGLVPAGSGEAVTAAAQAGDFSIGELGELAALTGNPVPALARALARRVPRAAAGAVHRGATSQDILDTAAMLLARRVIEVVLADLAQASAAAAVTASPEPAGASPARSSARASPASASSMACSHAMSLVSAPPRSKTPPNNPCPPGSSWSAISGISLPPFPASRGPLAISGTPR